MKKSNKQKILEAKANLESARMLEAIKSIAERRKELQSLYSGDLTTTVKTLGHTIEFMKAFEKFKGNNNCIEKDIKLVTDIVDGIKTKAKYEMELKEKDDKLGIARRSYIEALNYNKNLKSKFVKFVEDNIDGKLDKEEVKKFVQSFRSLDDIIDEHYKESENNQCEVDEHPF